jgi:hypothetical protein
MSVERKDYIVLGTNIRDHYDANYDEWWEDDEMVLYLEGSSEVEFQIIPSCYDSSYAIAGKILGEYDYHEGLPMINLANFNFDAEDYFKVEKFLHKFSLNLKPELLIFTHWY